MSAQHNDDHRTAVGISRRSLLAVGAVGVSGVALVACSKAASPSGEPNAGAGGTAATGTGAAGSKAALAKLSDINVGEAIAATGPDGAQIIISRPTASTVAAFSAVCTHQGCTVAPAGKQLDCPCHGSVFDATTGAVVNGPASRPLPAVAVTISGGDVVAG